MIKKYLADVPLKLIHIAKRQQGIMVRRGNPHSIKGIEDIARPGLRFVNRQFGSGTRIFFDLMLAGLGIEKSAINGYDREESSHTAVGVLVKESIADAGVGIYSAARAFSLDFIPLAEEDYDLVVTEGFAKDERFQILMDVITSREFKERLEDMGGYNTAQTGVVKCAFRPRRRDGKVICLSTITAGSSIMSASPSPTGATCVAGTAWTVTSLFSAHRGAFIRGDHSLCKDMRPPGGEKVRLTGGEPLARKGLPYLLGELGRIEGVADISLTTNAVLLGSMIEELKQAGLKRVNISLDTMKRDRFAWITGVDAFNEVIESIKRATYSGLTPIKINTVIIKGFNDDEILDFVRIAKKMGS